MGTTRVVTVDRTLKAGVGPILHGMAITFSNMVKTLFGRKYSTIQFPEQKRTTSNRYRGIHVLTQRMDGTPKCVACYMCATACPAHCIDIVAAPAPPEWTGREKYPETFVIDELRCIYCGMCEEACPVDAIELTHIYDIVGLTRQEMIFDKEKLLKIYDETEKAEPM